jgi:hypothetical protein
VNDEMSELIEDLLAIRCGCEQWPEGEGKVVALSVLDEMLAQARRGELPFEQRM